VAAPPRILPNERPARCAECGGQCCNTRPGLEAPERFLEAENPVSALAEALASGEWVLVTHLGVPWVDGVPPPESERRRILYYPRPATVRERGTGRADTDPSASPCVFLGRTGCRLDFEARPRQCRSLEPAVDFDCQADFGRLEAALAWRPHQGLVQAAVGRLPRTAP
jgi:Fe-S-cluster containining protein